MPIPEIGTNPFLTIQEFSKQKYVPSNEKYFSPSHRGNVSFDYPNNNGRYSIGQGETMFETNWSKASNTSIHIYSQSGNINKVSIAKGVANIIEINDARIFDNTSRVRTVHVNGIAIVQNSNGFYAAIKVLSLKDDTRGDNHDELTFEYVVQTNGSPDFTK